MSSAKRKSNKCDIPSPKLRPRCSTRLRQRPIASCSTEQNNRGLKTHPCRTPAQISNSWLLSLLLTTWPFWFAYVICSNQIKWGETPCSLKASHNDFQSTRSKAFDKSRLTIHKGVFANNVLSITMLAVKRCSSILRFLLNPCCSSGCHCSNGASMRPRIKYAKILYMRRMFAMGRKSVVTLDCFVFGNIWNNVLRHAHGISPSLRIVFMMLRMVHETFSGAKCNNSATKPHSSEALFAFIRLIAICNSCKFQSASVSWGGGDGLLGCPLRIFSSKSSKRTEHVCSSHQLHPTTSV